MSKIIMRPDTEITDLNKKAKAGIKALFGRQVLIQVITFGGGVALARILTPATFGVFAMVTAIVNMVSIFGDFGLGASLIQRKAALSDRDIQVGFTIQQALMSIVFVLLLIFAPWIVKLFPKAPNEILWLIRVLSLNLYLASWRSISVIQLERRMEFGKVAKLEVAEQIIYQGISVLLAALGFKVWSFVIATLVRGLIGSVVAYAIGPWPVRFAFDGKTAKQILKFGVPMQLNLILLSMGSWVTPLVGGLIIGPTQLGLVTFGSANGKKPLVVVNSTMRAAFPHLSRLQDNPAEFSRLVVRYITLLTLPMTFWFVLIAVAGRSIIHIVYSAKFLLASEALTIFAAAGIFETINWVAGVAQDAAGLPSLAAKRALFRSCAMVAIIVPLTLKFGYNAIPAGMLLVGIMTVPWSFTGLAKDLPRTICFTVMRMMVPVACGISLGSFVGSLTHELYLKAILSLFAAIVGYATPLLIIWPNWIKGLIGPNFMKRKKGDTESLDRAEVSILESNQAISNDSTISADLPPFVEDDIKAERT
jgi:O-antigen/teichoic acid export membrane protein